MTIRRYSDTDAHRWNQFVGDSKNGTFLFSRDYMDYHQDRFVDHSIIFENEKGKIIALIPANEVINEEQEKILYSHQGLTYGGLILSKKSKVAEVLEIFDLTREYLCDNGFKTWIYKQMPTIYHLYPAQEDEYALWRNNATITTCLISATIPLLENSGFFQLDSHRKRGMNHALLNHYEIKESNELEAFWPIMEQNLETKYSAKPVHTLAEMQLLMQRFPQAIKCYLAVKDGIPQAGAIVYLTNKETVHLQYCHATEQGKTDRVLDLLYITLIEEFQKQGFHYFDLGTSNEDSGRYLNETLIAHKQSFGARGIAYKTYLIRIGN